MKSWWLCLPVLGLLGCGGARYVPSGAVQPYLLARKSPSQVVVFYSDKEVTFPYIELGRVFIDGASRNPDELVETIREIAAKHGADAAIVLMETQENKAHPEKKTYTAAGIVIIKEKP